MSSVLSRVSRFSQSKRAEALAEVLEQGATALAAFARGLSSAEWRMRGPKDQRRFGVVVHHVATMYPLEIKLAQVLAGGDPVTGVTWDDVHAMNAAHAKEFDAVTKEDALALLEKNGAEAATAVRALSDEELNRFAPNSMYGGAPLSAQFMLEDHAVRHSWQHLAAIRSALKR